MNKQVLITILLIGLIFLTTRSIVFLENSKNRTRQLQLELSQNKKLNESLKQKIKIASSDEYIEKTATEKLNMTKNGYKIIIDETKVTNNKQEPTNNSKENNISHLEKWRRKFNL